MEMGTGGDVAIIESVCVTEVEQKYGSRPETLWRRNWRRYDVICICNMYPVTQGPWRLMGRVRSRGWRNSAGGKEIPCSAGLSLQVFASSRSFPAAVLSLQCRSFPAGLSLQWVCPSSSSLPQCGRSVQLPVPLCPQTKGQERRGRSHLVT